MLSDRRLFGMCLVSAAVGLLASATFLPNNGTPLLLSIAVFTVLIVANAYISEE
jgi:hypothetical protein